jgi:hypothetical protein
MLAFRRYRGHYTIPVWFHTCKHRPGSGMNDASCMGLRFPSLAGEFPEPLKHKRQTARGIGPLSKLGIFVSLRCRSRNKSIATADGRHLQV